MTEWFEQWFGEEYLRLYPHRDEQDAADAVALVARITPLAGRRVLDLGCGTGRHAIHLAGHGARVVGLDLSRALLLRARARPDGHLDLVRGDMRLLPFRNQVFDVIVNLFTSFGYFADDSQHQSVLTAASAALIPDGWFVLDYLHAECVRDRLIPTEERGSGSSRAVIKRRVSPDGRSVIKEIHLVEQDRTFQETVRLFSAQQLESMLASAGLTVRQRFGAYDGRELRGNTPRVILAARKT